MLFTFDFAPLWWRYAIFLYNLSSVNMVQLSDWGDAMEDGRPVIDCNTEETCSSAKRRNVTNGFVSDSLSQSFLEGILDDLSRLLSESRSEGMMES